MLDHYVIQFNPIYTRKVYRYSWSGTFYPLILCFIIWRPQAEVLKVAHESPLLLELPTYA